MSEALCVRHHQIFAAQTGFGLRANSVAVDDLNGDGRPDLAVANLTSQSVSAEALKAKVAEKYVEAFVGITKTGNTLIVPSNMAYARR